MGKHNQKKYEDHYNGSQPRYTHSCRQSDDTIFDIRIWGVDEVCHFTQYAKGTVYNLVSRGEIPFRKRGGGRRLVFIPSEVIQWFTGEL